MTVGPGPASKARAYLESPPPRVVLCANRLRFRHEIEECLVHELVHAYDYLVSGLKLTDCRPLAYRSVSHFSFSFPDFFLRLFPLHIVFCRISLSLLIMILYRSIIEFGKMF